MPPARARRRPTNSSRSGSSTRLRSPDSKTRETWSSITQNGNILIYERSQIDQFDARREPGQLQRARLAEHQLRQRQCDRAAGRQRERARPRATSTRSRLPGSPGRGRASIRSRRTGNRSPARRSKSSPKPPANWSPAGCARRQPPGHHDPLLQRTGLRRRVHAVRDAGRENRALRRQHAGLLRAGQRDLRRSRPSVWTQQPGLGLLALQAELGGTFALEGDIGMPAEFGGGPIATDPSNLDFLIRSGPEISGIAIHRSAGQRHRLQTHHAVSNR